MRIATSADYSDSYPAIAYTWSFYDQLHAHLTLDCLDDVRAIQRPESAKPPKRPRGR